MQGATEHVQRVGLFLRRAGCWFESVISRILKLLVNAKDVGGSVFVGNSHHETVSKADRLRNRFKL